MRGRDKFNKYSRLIGILSTLFGLFPRKVRENLFVHYRPRKGVTGMAIRYALLKTLAKEVGDNVSVHPDVYLFKLHNLSIGNNVSIHPLCYIDAAGGIEIGNDVSIAHNSSIISFNHQYDDLSIPIKDQELEKKPIIIGNDVWIGAKATILAGVTIENGSVIGAGAVVTHNVPKRSIVAGVPARVINSR